MAIPHYKLIVYAPRREDPTETTVLTPIAGASHSQPFQVTTMPEGALPGFRPFMMAHPKGRTGKMDLKSRTVDTGQMDFQLVDARVGTNAQRWITAFLGDAKGKRRTLGARVEVFESLDGGTTWAPFWCGRMTKLPLAGRAAMTMSVRDAAEDLRHEVFTDTPHSSIAYATRGTVFPNGRVGSYAGVDATAWATGTLRSTDHPSAMDRTIIVTGAPDGTDWVTDAVQAIDQTPSINLASDRYLTHPDALVRVKRLDTGTVGVFRLRKPGGTLSRDDSYSAGYFDWVERGEGYRVTKIAIQQLLPGEIGEAPIPPSGTDVEFAVIPGGEASSESSVFVDDVHPVAFIRDLLDGKFARLKAGTVQPQFVHPYETSEVSALIADESLGKVRGVFDAPESLRDLISEICLARGLAWRVNGSGRVSIIDVRLKSSSFTGPTITSSADLDTSVAPGCSPDATEQVTRMEATFYIDEVLTPAQIRKMVESGENVPAGGIREKKGTYAPADLEEEAIQREKALKLDLRMLRVVQKDGERANPAAIYPRLRELDHEVRAPYAHGAAEVSLPCLRTERTKDCQPGHVRLVNVAEIPNDAGNVRGGIIPMRCVSRMESGGRIDLTFVVLPDTVAVAPAVGTLTASAIDAGGWSVAVPVTANASGEAVEVWQCTTSTSVSVRPAEGDAGWLLAQRLSGTGSAYLDVPVASGGRMWIRARSVPDPAAGDRFRLPSSYAFPAAGYVDLTPAPALGVGTDAWVDDASGEVSVQWAALGSAVAVRVHWGIATIGVTPGLTDSFDYAASTFDLPSVALSRGEVIRIEVEPWTGWTGSAVSGTAGARREMQRERATAPDPSVAAPALAVNRTANNTDDEVWSIAAAVAPGASLPLRWRHYLAGAAPGAWTDVPGGTLSASLTITRLETRTQVVFVNVVDGDGRDRNEAIVVSARNRSVDPGTGKIDPLVPLHGSARTIADINTDAEDALNWLAALGALAYEDAVELAKLGTTIIVGGYIKSTLIEAEMVRAKLASFGALSAIVGVLGTVVSGMLQNAASTPTAVIRLDAGTAMPGTATRYLDLGATGSDPFLKIGGVELRVDGSHVWPADVKNPPRITGTAGGTFDGGGVEYTASWTATGLPGSGYTVDVEFFADGVRAGASDNHPVADGATGPVAGSGGAATYAHAVLRLVDPSDVVVDTFLTKQALIAI
jgi:hypothetical protein